MNEIIKLPTVFDTSLLAGQVRSSTIRSYQMVFTEYLNFAGDWPTALEPATLAKWRTHLSGLALSPNTINRKLTSIKAVMKAATEQGYLSPTLALAFSQVDGVSISAMRDRLKANARTKILPEEMRSLCNAPDTLTLAGLMHRALLLTLASSGLRITEAITLRPKQILKRTNAGKTGYVVEVIGKTDIQPRDAPLSPEAYSAIQSWLHNRPIESEWIFTGFGGRGDREPRTNHIHPVSAWQIVKRYAAKVGLEHIKPHDFRRFVGTQLARSDPRQAQRALGHKDISTTYRHYVLDELELGLTDNLF